MIWSKIQTGSLIVFCAAALVGTWALILERYGLVVANAAIMAINFYLYQLASKEIQRSFRP